MTEQVMQVINSNDLSALSEICARIIKSPVSNGSDPFASETVITMNKGMKVYLQQSIASYNSICANLEFNQVWEFIWKLHKSINGADSSNRYSHEHMTWSIFSLIGSLDKDDPVFVKMREYVSLDDDREMSYQLCGVIADSFDQYQMFRPDWIQQWNYFVPDDFSKVEFDDNSEPHLKGSGAVFEFIKKTSRGSVNLQRTLFGNLWQMKLWCMLKGNLRAVDSEKDNSSSLWDRATVVASLTRRFSSDTENKELIKILPKRVFIFGVSSLPTQVISLFAALGKLIPVFFMHLNPCAEYWGDLTSVKGDWLKEKQKIIKYLHGRSLSKDVDLEKFEGRIKSQQVDVSTLEGQLGDEYCSLFEDTAVLDGEGELSAIDSHAELIDGNPMLLSLGRQGRDTLNVLLSHDSEINFTNVFFEYEGNTVLNNIKNQLLNLRTADRDRNRIEKGDESLQVRVCYTPLREVEVLRDRMLSLFKKDRSLRPVDLVCMVPNVEEYAPYIESVFGSVDRNSKNFIPYSICDKSGQASSPVADALIQLLSIGSTKITANLIIELLSVESIAGKFLIDSEDLTVIATWFKENCMHWGLDERDVQEILKTEDPLNLPWTIEEGIDRLLKGFMLGENSGTDAFDSIASTDFHLLSKLCSFLESLKLLKDTFYPSLDLGAKAEFTNLEWSEKLETVIFKNFFVLDERSFNEIKNIKEILLEMNESINNLNTGSSLEGLNESEVHSLKIKLPVFRAKLIHALGNTHDSSSYLKGSVSFCSLMPMRAVPFRYIFILGLKDTDFPRTDTYPSFNLLSLKPLLRCNDRARASDDRFIFLESFLSAKDGLYLSYVGRSVNDKSELNPSAVITELYDYLSDSFYVTEENRNDDEKNRREVIAAITRVETLSSYDSKNFLEQEGHEKSFNEAVFFNPDDTGIYTRGNTPLGAITQNLSFKEDDSKELFVDIESLTSFFCKPAKEFLNKKLNISLYTDNGVDISDSEPFCLPYLDGLNIVLEILDKTLENSELSPSDVIDKELNVLSSKGVMPYGVLINDLKENLKDNILNLNEKVKQFKDNFASCHYSRVLEDFTCRGRKIKVIFDGTLKPHSNVIVDIFHKSNMEKSVSALFKGIFTRLAYTYVQGKSIVDEVRIMNGSGEFYDGCFAGMQDVTSGSASDEILKEALELYMACLEIPVPLTKRLYENVLGEYINNKDTVNLDDFICKTLESISDFGSIFEYDEDAAYLFSKDRLFSQGSDVADSALDNIKELSVRMIKFLIKNTVGCGE